ncbi:peptidoglycan recognition family protein [Roseateles sp.]|uniref:peptidoglycan recognition protein family protein n=1 Tax=Roseateles sp. TaxID=1971397 RepID=UPI00286D6421|nr:peptidoglycan recognition family protein [Roseateles sp.]
MAMAVGLGGCAHPQRTLPAPAIIAVPIWGGSAIAAETLAQTAPQRIKYITLHHQGETWPKPSSAGVDGADVAAYLRRLQSWSRLSQRWLDIPYHYVVAPDGRIYAARPDFVAGDTHTEYRPDGHALVMLLGNFEDAEPSAAALHSTVELMAWLAQENGLSADAIASHRDYSAQTVCPGKHLYRYVENGFFRRAVAARLQVRVLLP